MGGKDTSGRGEITWRGECEESLASDILTDVAEPKALRDVTMTNESRKQRINPAFRRPKLH